MAKSLEQRFWEKVEKTDACWNWVGCLTHNGYGSLSSSYKERRAHRYSWVLSGGVIPAGMLVLHSCDNRRCVRVEHLRVGSAQDNSQEMIRHGRGFAPLRERPELIRRGEDCSSAKLSRGEVIEIRREYGVVVRNKQRELASKYGVSESAILLIANRKRWGHVNE